MVDIDEVDIEKLLSQEHGIIGWITGKANTGEGKRIDISIDFCSKWTPPSVYFYVILVFSDAEDGFYVKRRFNGNDTPLKEIIDYYNSL